MDYKLPKLPERPQSSNKGTFGKVLNIAGSEFMPGAAYLSSISALKIGAGYVQLTSEISVLNKVSQLAPEIVLSTYRNTNIENFDVISFGCGCSTDEFTRKLLEQIHKNRKNIPTVIDADGLNVLASSSLMFDKNTILTPHPLEAARLLGITIDEILEDIEKSAKMVSEKYNCITVLKTSRTVVTDGEIVYINTSGCSALAKAGSGDILTGMISGLLAQNMPTFDAAALGVFLHGIAGELAAENLSEYCVLATDTLRYIPFAVKKYLAEYI